ncbi:hypothetical protein GQ457_01G043260 [Hibiscus cannabinus]
MESRRAEGTLNTQLKSPLSASPCSHSSSPEFEFWMVRNPPFPHPDLVSADELFVNGVLLPLHLLPNNKQPEHNNPRIDSYPPASQPDPDPVVAPDPVPVLSASKRWRCLFKKEKGRNGEQGNEDHKDKDREKLIQNPSQSGASGAELNINIWPFSRSRSATTRPRMTTRSNAARKVSSAPCSRSNSAGDSKYRKWPSSPGRAGVHLGRSSPVWQVRRGGSAAEKGGSKKEVTETRRGKIGNGTKVKILNLNVPMCIGYRHHLSCRTDGNSAILAGISTAENGGGNVRSSDANVVSGSKVYNLRNLFAKKDN